MATTVWATRKPYESQYPLLINGINDVALISTQGHKPLDSQVRQILINSNVVPRYFSPVVTDGSNTVFFYLTTDGAIYKYFVDEEAFVVFTSITPSHDFDFDFTLSASGEIISSSSLFFYNIAQNGTIIRYCTYFDCQMDGFEEPINYSPFWDDKLNMPSSVSIFENTFVIGGSPVDRFDLYSTRGTFIKSIFDYTDSTHQYVFSDEIPCKTRFDSTGRIWISTLERLYVFSNTLEKIRYWNRSELTLDGRPINLDGWFGVDRNGLLWLYGLPEGGSLSMGALELDW